MKINEKIFLSFFNKLIDNNNSKNKLSKNNNLVINNISNYIKLYQNNNKIDGKDSDETSNNSVEGDLLVKNNKSVIKNRKYSYKLTKNENILLQYSLDRLLKGILSGSRESFGKCLHEILINFKDYIDFDNLILLFLDLYNIKNVSNQEIRYLYLGRLEILLHLCKINLFTHYTKTSEICKIVEYIQEAYNYKVYLQESSNVVLIAIVNQLQDSLKNEVIEKILDVFSNNDSLLLYFKTEFATEKCIQNSSELQLMNKNVVENKIMSILKDMKNVYPIVNIHLIDVIVKLNDPKMFKKLLNVLDCMLEGSLNSVKTALIVYLILLFKVKQDLFLILVDNLSIYFKVIIKYYKYNNQLYIKQFINNYLHLLSNNITNCNYGNKLVNSIYDNLITSKNDKNSGVNSDIIPYVNLYYNLLQQLHCTSATTSFNNKGIKVELQMTNKAKEEVRQNGSESVDNWDNENIYKVLNSINMYDKNCNVFLAVIKSLMNKLLLNSPDPKLIFSEIMLKTDCNSFKITLIKMLILNNNFNLTTELLSHYTRVRDKKSETAESKEDFYSGLLDLYISVLTKYVNIMVNKRLNNRELINYTSILCDNVKILNKVQDKNDVLLERFYNHIKDFKTNSSPSVDTNTIFENILLVTLYLYYVTNTHLKRSYEDGLLASFMNYMYCYVTGKENKQADDENLLYNMIIYNIFNYDKDEDLMNKLYSAINKLVFKCVNEKFSSQIWETIFKITLNNDFNIINDILIGNNILKQGEYHEEIEEDDEDTDEDEDADADEDDTEISEDEEDTSSVDEEAEDKSDDDEEDTATELENDADDLVVESLSELINETPNVNKEKEKKKDYSLKITGYNLLLYLDNLDLDRLYLVLKDYNSSFKHNYSHAIHKFLTKMAENTTASANNVSVKNNAPEDLGANVFVTVKIGDDEKKFELSEKVVRVVNYVLNNKNMKNALVLSFKIMSKNHVDMEKVLNYMTCMMYTKRTVLNHDILITLYKTFKVPCKVNLFELLTNNMKSVIKSKLLTLYTFLLNNDQVDTIEDDLEVVNKLLLQFNKTEKEDGEFEVKVMDTGPTTSKQYVKSLILCINNMVRHVKKGPKLKENKEVLDKLNEINQVVKLLNNKVINKYYVKYTM